MEVHASWNTPETLEVLGRCWDEDRPVLLLNPAVSQLAPVQDWLGKLGVPREFPAGSGPLPEGLGGAFGEGIEPGFHLFLLTSGTTGAPRLVALDRQSIRWNVEAVARHLALDPETEMVLHVPVFHAFGAVLCFLLARILGGPVHPFLRFEPGPFLSLLTGRHHRSGMAGPGLGAPVVLPFVPAMIRSLPEPHELPPGDRARLQRVRGVSISGGDLVFRSDLERLGRLLPGVRHTVGYGLTEAGPALTHTDPDHRPGDGHIGKALSGVELKPPSVGEGGGWRFRSPGQAVAIRSPGEPGWRPVRRLFLDTGDDLARSEDGSLRFCGRRSWSFKRRGEMISPALVETTIRRCWGGSSAAVAPPQVVVGPAPRDGLILLVEGREGDMGEERRELVRALESLPTLFRPSEIRWVGRFPRNALGKIERRALLGGSLPSR